MRFGHNTREYKVRNDENDKLYRRNWGFPKPVRIPDSDRKPASILVQKQTTEIDQTLLPEIKSSHWAFQNRAKRDRRKLLVRFGEDPTEIFTY